MSALIVITLIVCGLILGAASMTGLVFLVKRLPHRTGPQIYVGDTWKSDKTDRDES